MSSLWTPEGEHRVPRDDPPAAGSASADTTGRAAGGRPPGGARAPVHAGDAGDSAEDSEEAELAQRLEELRHQLLATPVEVVVANHAYGLFELAAIHLSQRPVGLVQARLAVDALGALVEGLSGRLGEAEASLVDALAQIRLAYVQILASEQEGSSPADQEPTATGGPVNEAG